jgi:CRP-like cAMP-binding protein
MNTVGAQCNFLKASAPLKDGLQISGRNERYAATQVLFREDDGNAGVFLVVRGKIRMGIRGLPKLDRLLSAGSLLGLPSTFTGHAYSLTAEAVTQADVMHIPQDSFLQLMRERPELCREATQILGREVTFIQSALAERRRLAFAKKPAPSQAGALV